MGARADASGEMSLAAYIVVRDGAEASSVADLRRWLQSLLPDYMVPSAFVSLEALPLTPNGKVDRQALPDPGQARLTKDADFVPPRGPVEEIIASAWGSLLGVERVGAHDNFFDLGGHSLLATQVVSRLREAFGVEIPLRSLFESSTVAGLATQIESMKHGGASSDLAPIDACCSRWCAAAVVLTGGPVVSRSACARTADLQRHRGLTNPGAAR